MKHYLKQTTKKLTLLSAIFLLLASLAIPYLTNQVQAVNVPVSFPSTPLENTPNLNDTVKAAYTVK